MPDHMQFTPSGHGETGSVSVKVSFSKSSSLDQVLSPQGGWAHRPARSIWGAFWGAEAPDGTVGSGRGFVSGWLGERDEQASISHHIRTSESPA